jgi:hypothetical protein
MSAVRYPYLRRYPQRVGHQPGEAVNAPLFHRSFPGGRKVIAWRWTSAHVTECTVRDDEGLVTSDITGQNLQLAGGAAKSLSVFSLDLYLRRIESSCAINY